MNIEVSSACSVRVREFSSTNTVAIRLANRWARAGSLSEYDTTNVSRRRGSLVVATGSGTVISVARRILAIAGSLGAPDPMPSSRTTRARMGRLSSCCDSARSRSWLSSVADWLTRFGETVGAVTPNIVLDLYSLGSHLTRASPTMIDVTMGVTSHQRR